MVAAPTLQLAEEETPSWEDALHRGDAQALAHGALYGIPSPPPLASGRVRPAPAGAAFAIATTPHLANLRAAVRVGGSTAAIRAPAVRPAPTEPDVPPPSPSPHPPPSPLPGPTPSPPPSPPHSPNITAPASSPLAPPPPPPPPSQPLPAGAPRLTPLVLPSQAARLLPMVRAPGGADEPVRQILHGLGQTPLAVGHPHERNELPCRALAVHPWLPYYLSAHAEGSVFLWRWGQRYAVMQARVPAAPSTSAPAATGASSAGAGGPVVTSVRWSGLGDHFGCTDRDGCVTLWRLEGSGGRFLLHALPLHVLQLLHHLANGRLSRLRSGDAVCHQL